MCVSSQKAPSLTSKVGKSSELTTGKRYDLSKDLYIRLQTDRSELQLSQVLTKIYSSTPRAQCQLLDLRWTVCDKNKVFQKCLKWLLATSLMTFDGKYDNPLTICCLLLPTVHFLLILLKFCLDIGEKSDFVAGDLTKHARARNRTMIELLL